MSIQVTITDACGSANARSVGLIFSSVRKRLEILSLVRKGSRAQKYYLTKTFIFLNRKFLINVYTSQNHGCLWIG